MECHALCACVCVGNGFCFGDPMNMDEGLRKPGEVVWATSYELQATRYAIKNKWKGY